MSASSIGAAKGGDYALYLEDKTIAREPSGYYLSRDGEPVQKPGRWLASPTTLERLGIEGNVVDGEHFTALMKGRDPAGGGWLRRAGADGQRGGGIDLTFSAPKSVSVVWALGSDAQRKAIEEAHARAVEQSVAYLREQIPALRRRQDGRVVEQLASDFIAAEYRHTTARGVGHGELPDPQLHSHVVVTGAVREDGQIVAIASRPIFRAARELGAVYRSALAVELRGHGFAVQPGTGKDARYFELAGVPDELREAFSKRSREVAEASERFRARYGRAPERGELRSLAITTRTSKQPRTLDELERAWRQTAEPFSLDEARLAESDRSRTRDRGPADRRPFEQRVVERLTERTATFTFGELRTVALEQSVGVLSPREALDAAGKMVRDRQVLLLEDGRMTTPEIHAAEQAIERRLMSLAAPAGRGIDRTLKEAVAETVERRIGGPLSGEQSDALDVITGKERAAILVGSAGTGKGVVVDVAAFAEQVEGNQTFGVAVSGATAQRLGHESPALEGQTLTVDALLARAEHGYLQLDSKTTVYLDEAGMVDTRRLDRLAETIERSGAKLVLIGDAAQLPSIGAGGMFERLAKQLPRAELQDVRRTLDPGERKAWADLRAGRADRALAHYKARGRLHIDEHRDQALEHAVQRWEKLTQSLPIEQVALISDASNVEIDRLNARAQQHRISRHELGETELPVPGVHYGLREGDHVALIDQHHARGQLRIENGTRGTVRAIEPHGALIDFETGAQRLLGGEDIAALRLAYAQHVHRAQGATVQRALVLTGGWQTSKEPAYVQASRARDGAEFFVNRQELGAEGNDLQRIDVLAERMTRSRRQQPSLDRLLAPQPARDEPHSLDDFGLRLGIPKLSLPRLVPWPLSRDQNLTREHRGPER